ncbi:Manganese/iron superoxide dismutase [Hypoxylon argillaceum]|nr:Manganese/iron superoxide dismutase [Hypoxylon argillaceum]KAI1157186.1 Manganese/iron superoxide dismutase [Nemania diffusa]
MLRPRLRIPQAGALLRRTALFTRSQHTVPILDHFRQDNAVPGLLSPAGYSTAWTEYMQHVTDKLNIMIAGTDYEYQDALTILKSAAREPAQAAVFNYASMAHNNHFFFSQLVNLQTLYERSAQARSAGQTEAGGNAAESEPAELDVSESRISPKLRLELEKQFSSIETLRREFLTVALGMFGPGFVWLVKNANTQDLRILTTYLAGTPYTAAHWRRQSVDWNTASANRTSVNAFMERAQTGAGNTTSRFTHLAPGGTDVIPLLCLNTWEHVWLTDYGIGGKGEYVQRWWDTIDWDKVESLTFPSRRDEFV